MLSWKYLESQLDIMQEVQLEQGKQVLATRVGSKQDEGKLCAQDQNHQGVRWAPDKG
mgnify:CR=1 FL=1